MSVNSRLIVETTAIQVSFVKTKETFLPQLSVQLVKLCTLQYLVQQCCCVNMLVNSRLIIETTAIQVSFVKTKKNLSHAILRTACETLHMAVSRLTMLLL